MVDIYLFSISILGRNELIRISIKMTQKKYIYQIKVSRRNPVRVSAANSQEISIYFNKYLFGQNKYFLAYFWEENKYILA